MCFTAAPGSELRIRPAGGGFNSLPAVDAAYSAIAGATQTIKDIVLDNTDWEAAFVADNLERVFWTSDAGVTWNQIPGLSALIGDELEALEFVRVGAMREVFAGGRDGVFVSRDLGTGFGPWSELAARACQTQR